MHNILQSTDTHTFTLEDVLGFNCFDAVGWASDMLDPTIQQQLLQ